MTNRRGGDWFFVYGALLLGAVNAIMFFAWDDVANLIAAALCLLSSAIFALRAIYLNG